MTEASKKYLLELAKKSIGAGFRDQQVGYGGIPDDVQEIRGVFVTLTISGQLRGCIGNIEPIDEVFKSVVRNSQSAAFEDPRFPSLTEHEFDQISIEISILKLPKLFSYDSTTQLLEKLSAEHPGVVIESGYYRATYLPQVWDDIASAEEFLSSLCVKASLAADYWKRKTADLKIYTYTVDKFSDERG